MTDLDELRRLANETTATGTWGFDPDWAIYPRDAEFIAAASPAVVLDLIARVKTAEAQVERVLEWAHIEEQRASVRELSDPNAYARRCVYSAIIERLGGDA